MNGEQEYIENRCFKCLYKHNDKDLCNIVKTMDGTYRCSNENILEDGEFIKTKRDGICKLIKSEIDGSGLYCGNVDKKAFWLRLDNAIKHSKKIKEVLSERRFNLLQSKAY